MTASEWCPEKLKFLKDELFLQHEPTIWPLTPYEEVTVIMKKVWIYKQEIITQYSKHQDRAGFQIESKNGLLEM